MIFDRQKKIALSATLISLIASAILAFFVLQNLIDGSTQLSHTVLAFGLAGDYQMASQIGREDLDELAVVRNISYYRILGAMSDHARKVEVVGIIRRNSRAGDAIAAITSR